MCCPVYILFLFQTTFYLHDYLTCKKGEEIYGVFKMVTNPRNRKDLDFEINVDFQVWTSTLNFDRVELNSPNGGH